MDDSELRKRLRYALLVDFLKVDGVNIFDLTTDLSDPRNAIYRVPLSDGREKDVVATADATLDFVVAEHSKEPNFDDDVAYEQCLTDARRMLLDPNYSRLWELVGDLHDIDHAPIEAIQRCGARYAGLTVEQIACLHPHQSSA